MADSRINIGYLEEDVKKETALAISEANKIVETFQKSMEKYPVIPQFATDPYVPDYK